VTQLDRINRKIDKTDALVKNAMQHYEGMLAICFDALEKIAIMPPGSSYQAPAVAIVALDDLKTLHKENAKVLTALTN
jgi:hypothetical protein